MLPSKNHSVIESSSRSNYRRVHRSIACEGPRKTFAASQGTGHGAESNDSNARQHRQRQQPKNQADPNKQRATGVQQSNTYHESRAAPKTPSSGAAPAASSDSGAADPVQRPALSGQQQQRQGPSQQLQQQHPQDGKPRLTWRSSSSKAQPAAADEATKQQQIPHGAAPRLSWRSNAGSGSDSTSQAAGASAESAAAASALQAPDADVTEEDESAAPLYAAARPPPGFFRSQVTTASDDEIDLFLLRRINTRHAAPASREHIAQDTEDFTGAYLAANTEAKQQLPPEYQQALAKAATDAAAALAAARSRPGGLAEDELVLAETAADVAGVTRSPFTAQLAIEVLMDLAAGRQPEPESVEVVMDPATVAFESFGAHGPAFDEAMLRTADGVPPFADPWSACGDAVLEYLESCRSWESAARIFMTARGTPGMSVPQLVLLCRVLPGLVSPGQLGFRSRLRVSGIMQDILEDITTRRELISSLTASDLHTVLVAVGKLSPAPGVDEVMSAGLTDEKVTAGVKRVILQQLPHFSVHQLCDVLWGLGHAGVAVGDDQWSGRLWLEATSRARQVPLVTVALAKGLYGCALLQYKPPRASLKAFYQSSKQHITAFTPAQVCDMLRAVAVLELQPPPSWLVTVLGMLHHGQMWSTDGQIISYGICGSVAELGRQGVAAAAAAAEALAAAGGDRNYGDLEAALAAAAAAASESRPMAAVGSVFDNSHNLLAATTPVPGNIAAAVVTAGPYLYQQVTEGPLPCSRQSVEYYWTHLLDGSHFGGSSSSSLLSGGLPRILPAAPPSLMMLSPTELLHLVESLSDVQFCAEDEEVADLFDHIWNKGSAGGGSSRRSEVGQQGMGNGQKQSETAAAATTAVTGLVRYQDHDTNQQQQQGKRGFGGKQSNKSKKQQQQQKQQQRSSQSSGDSTRLDSKVVAAFDAASGGLWTAALEGNWSLRELAAATATIGICSSSDEEELDIQSTAVDDSKGDYQQEDHDHDDSGDPGRYELEHLDLDLDAAAAAAGHESLMSASSSTTPADASAAVSAFMPGWYAASQALLPHTEPTVLVAMLRAVATLTDPARSPFGQGLLPKSWQQQQDDDEKEDRSDTQSSPPAAGLEPTPDSKCSTQPGEGEDEYWWQSLQVPPLPHAPWVSAAVQRLMVTRSAYSGLALLHAFESLAMILQEHPQRQVLLLPPSSRQQQPQQGLWWWQEQHQDWLQNREAASSEDDGAARDAAATSSSAAAWDGSWMFANTPFSSHSSSSADSSSVYSSLRELAVCLGAELGTMLSLQSLVDALVHITRLSPDLVDRDWLQHHEDKLTLLLQQTGWTAGQQNVRSSASSSKRTLEADCMAAVEAGLTPECCQLLLVCYEECGYVIRCERLREVCELLAGVAAVS